MTGPDLAGSWTSIQTGNQQLDQSNPVLTAIADAMTAEASALECGNAAVAETMRKRKTELTTQLQEMSDRFSLLTSEAS